MSKFVNNLNSWQMTLEDVLGYLEIYSIDHKDLISYDRTIFKHLLLQLIVVEEEIRKQHEILQDIERLNNSNGY